MFDFSTLITDRTNDDVSYLSELMRKPFKSWTSEELDQFNTGMLKGGYWWTDLNRVTSCMDYLDEELKKLGYKSGYTSLEKVWSKADTPTVAQLNQYLGNVKKIRSTLAEIPQNPMPPDSMKKTTATTANAIEKILQNINAMLENIKHTTNLGWALGISDIGLYGGV